MSAVDYTTTALIADMRVNCMTPESDALFTNTRLLSLLTFQQNTTVVPQLLSVQEEFFVHTVDLPLEAGVLNYAIPARAVGSKVRDVALVDASGNERYTQRVNLSDKKMLVFDSGVNSFNYGFYFKNDDIVLLSDLSGQFTSLRLYYYRRPSNLVSTANAAQITAIDTGTLTVTCDSVPGTWGPGDEVDFIYRLPNFKSLADDVEISAVSNNDITLASLPAGLAVGDWLSLSCTSPIPQLPYECHPLLAQLGACKALEAMGDKNVEVAWGRYEKMRSDLFKMITPRADAPPQKVISPNNIANRGWGAGYGWWGR